MEILLGIVVFALLGAVTLYGYSRSMNDSRAHARETGGGGDDAARGSRDTRNSESPSSPNLNL